MFLNVIEELSKIAEEIATNISFETLIIRYSFNVFFITNINTIKRRYDLLKN